MAVLSETVEVTKEATGESGSSLEQPALPLSQSTQPPYYKTITAMSTRIEVESAFKNRLLPIFLKSSRTHSRQAKSSLGLLTQSSDVSCPSETNPQKRKSYQRKETDCGAIAEEKRMKVSPEVPASFCFSFALHSNSISELNQNKRVTRSCLRCNEQKLKVCILIQSVQD